MICIDAMETLERSHTALDSGLEDLPQNWLGLQRNLCLKKGSNLLKAHFSPLNYHQDELLHNRFMVPDNTQIIFTEI